MRVCRYAGHAVFVGGQRLTWQFLSSIFSRVLEKRVISRPVCWTTLSELQMKVWFGLFLAQLPSITSLSKKNTLDNAAHLGRHARSHDLYMPGHMLSVATFHPPHTLHSDHLAGPLYFPSIRGPLQELVPRPKASPVRFFQPLAVSSSIFASEKSLLSPTCYSKCGWWPHRIRTTWEVAKKCTNLGLIQTLEP